MKKNTIRTALLRSRQGI